MLKEAVILCGGKGTRLLKGLRPSEVSVPKPLMEVGGLPFVVHSINMLRGIGLGTIYLLVGDSTRSYYEHLVGSKCVVLVDAEPEVNRGIQKISLEGDSFFLLNGDCFPLMDWRAFSFSFSHWGRTCAAWKTSDVDAGAAIVRVADVLEDRVDCSNIAGMVEDKGYGRYMTQGGLHIGNLEGLNRAREYMDMVGR